MKLSRCLLAKKGWPRSRTEPAWNQQFAKQGPVKWRDFQSRYTDPPYWYKWSTKSPYSPQEQNRIRSGADIGWYQHNYHKLKLVPPDEWLINVGDTVEVLVGKDKGKQGQIVQVVPHANIIIVGGLNCIYEQREEGGQVQRVEEPLMHHEVSLLDPVDSKPVEVEFRADSEGKRVRVALRSEQIITWPVEILSDGTPKNEYKSAEKDTLYDDAVEVTFSPSLDSWEDQLKKAFNIVDPPRRTTYWY